MWEGSGGIGMSEELGFLGNQFRSSFAGRRMKLIAILAVFGLVGTAWSESSEEDCGRLRDRVPKRQVTQPSSPLPLPIVAPGPPGSCGARRMKNTKLNPDWKRIIPNIPGLPVDTFYGEAPWMVRILADGKFVCGGTLVNPQAVLTAAHCIKWEHERNWFHVPLSMELGTVFGLARILLFFHSDEKVRLWEVEVGEWNASSLIEPLPTQRQTAATIVAHKDFNHLNSANNIAMIFVQEPFSLHETVGIMCLADSLSMINPKTCLAAGWGKDGQGNGYEYSPVLRKTNLPVLPNDKCQEKLRTTALGDRFELMPNFVCAGGVDKRDTCQGDGGGPLYCETNENQNRYALYGIIAWGIGCGETNPTVFSSVPYHYAWIFQNLERYTS